MPHINPAENIKLHAIENSRTLANETARLQMQNSLWQAAEQTETTHDLMLRFFNMQLEITMAKIGCDLGLFRILSERDEPFSVDTLAHRTGAAPSLIRRIMRYLASMRHVTETSKDHFKANQSTKSLGNPVIKDCLSYIFHVGGPVYQAFPDALKENGYKDAATTTAWNKGHDTSLDFVSYGKQNPKYLKWFQSLMSVPREGDWLDVFSINSLALLNHDNQAIFVDIGGGIGHQSARLRARFPELPGRIIVQDLPEVLNHAPKMQGIELMPHNFFEPQPVRGAKAYYLRTVLHDWDDEKASQILRMTADAMDKDSVLLIDDMALPDTGAHWWSSVLDMHLLAMLGSRERTENEWQSLIGSAGLNVLSIRPYHPMMRHSVIIAQLPQL